MNTQRIIMALVLILIIGQVFATYHRGDHLQSSVKSTSEVFTETLGVTAFAGQVARVGSTLVTSELLGPVVFLLLPVVIGYFAHPMIKRTFDAAWDNVVGVKKPTKVVNAKTPHAVLKAQPTLPPPPHAEFHTLQERIAQTAKLQNYTGDTLEKRVELMYQ